MISDLPTEILREILRRVPVESLFFNRSVCKLWCRIIDDPTFAKLHFRRGIGDDWVIHMNSTGKLFILPLREMVFKKFCYVEYPIATNVKTLVGRGVPRIRFPVPTCNGLILLSSCKNNLVWRIWNPFTGESLELGQCDEFVNVKCRKFDYPYSGIGYDETNDDYKIVRIVEFRTYIYSVNLKEWRRIEDFPDSNSSIGEWNGVFAYGALHWVAYSKGQDGYLGWIAALDLSTEKYRKIQLPSEIPELNDEQVLGLDALSECLFLSYPELEGDFVVWMMKDYGCQTTWVKRMSFEIEDQISPIAYLKSKEQILLRDELHDDGREFYWHDLVNKRSKRFSMEIDPHDEFDGSRKYVFDKFASQVFPASLVRLRRSDGADEGVASEAKAKRKRKRDINDRLSLKLVFGDSHQWPDDWRDKQMDFVRLMFGDEEWPDNYMDIWMDSVSDGD